MIELTGEPAQLHFTIEIKRATTGEIETYDMIGHVVDIEEVKEDGSNTHDSGA